MYTKTVTVFSKETYCGDDPAWHNCKLSEFEGLLANIKKDIPAEHLDSATIEIDRYFSYGEPEASMKVEYQRPMTEDEINYIKDAERQAGLNEIAMLEARLARVKANHD